MRHHQPVPADYLGAAAKLYGNDGDRRRNFDLLTRAEQAAAIRRMASDGHSDGTIASATGLSKEAVRQVLAEPRPAVNSREGDE